MNEQQYQTWWQLHRRAALGEPLSEEEGRICKAGLAEMEAGEWAHLRPAAVVLQPLQQRWRELTALNRELAEQEAGLREQAAQLEQQYLALTGERISLEA
ncbi:MAG TPA: hypothetical protein VNQ79_03190 [Blastocatellia bacterium]|nr:hypothetical protein [Blastocatellia bacterium]